MLDVESVGEGGEISSRNSTLDVEFVRERMSETSFKNSTLDVELEGEGGSNKSAGVGENDGLGTEDGGVISIC